MTDLNQNRSENFTERRAASKSLERTSLSSLVSHRERKRGETCDACGKPLIQPDTGRPRRYCSVGCRREAERVRRAAHRDAYSEQTRNVALLRAFIEGKDG